LIFEILEGQNVRFLPICTLQNKKSEALKAKFRKSKTLTIKIKQVYLNFVAKNAYGVCVQN